MISFAMWGRVQRRVHVGEGFDEARWTFGYLGQEDPLNPEGVGWLVNSRGVGIIRVRGGLFDSGELEALLNRAGLFQMPEDEFQRRVTERDRLPRYTDASEFPEDPRFMATLVPGGILFVSLLFLLALATRSPAWVILMTLFGVALVYAKYRYNLYRAQRPLP